MYLRVDTVRRGRVFGVAVLNVANVVVERVVDHIHVVRRRLLVARPVDAARERVVRVAVRGLPDLDNYRVSSPLLSRSKRLSHHIEFRQDEVDLTGIRVRIQEHYHALSAVEQLAQRRPVALLDGQARRHVCEVGDTRVVEGGLPDVGEGDVLGVREEEREDLVGVGVKPGLDGLEVIDDLAAVEENLGWVNKAAYGTNSGGRTQPERRQSTVVG